MLTGILCFPAQSVKLLRPWNENSRRRERLGNSMASGKQRHRWLDCSLFHGCGGDLAESEPVLIIAIIANAHFLDYFYATHHVRYLSPRENSTGKVLVLIPVYRREYTSSQRWRTTSKLHNWSQRNQALHSNSVYTCSHSCVNNS